MHIAIGSTFRVVLWTQKISEKEAYAMKKNLIAVTGLCVFVFGGGALSSAAVLAPPLPHVQTYKEIPYLSGGVGLDERKALRSMTKGDNLKLSFALKNRDYLSDVEVVITDNKGNKVMEAVSEGPWFFTKLPAGEYTDRATTMGETLQQVAHMTSRGQTQLYFSWNESTLRGPGRSLTRK